MSTSLDKFRDLCSMIREPHLRLLFEAWAVKNIQTLQVECRVGFQDSFDKALSYTSETALRALVHEVVVSAQRLEMKQWLQGDVDWGKIITRRVDILKEIE